MFDLIKAYYLNMIPHLTPGEWQAMEDFLEIKVLKKGEHLIKQGQVCNHVFFVNYGFTRVYKEVKGREISSGFIGANQYISAYDSFLTRQPSHENIDVIEDAELLLLSYDQMQHLYDRYPVYQIFGRKIAEQLFIMVSQRSNALLLLTPEERYKNMIQNESKLLQQVPQYMLASYIGVTPEHLSRIRKKMMAG